jgi:6-phosphogluconolactonase
MKKNNYIVYLSFLMVLHSCSNNTDPIRLFAGQFTENSEPGLSIFDMDQADGTLKLVSESDAGPNPSYFCISGKRGLIYAANEVMNFNAGVGGGVTTLKYNSKTGTAEKLSELAIPNGSPCFISLSPDNNYLFLANYTGISDTISFPENQGKISHPHMISSDPAGKRIYQTDLGFDQIVIYNFDPVSGKLQVIQNGIFKLTPGSGPRHFVFNSDGTKMYVINELNSSLSVFDVAATGELEIIQTLTTLREGYKGESFCADVHISKNGDFLYGSNRGENTIVTFRIGTDGLLSLAGHTSCGGDWPRNFVIDPSGKFILVGNQRSGNISVFGIDKKTGIPVEPGKDYKVSTPACLRFLE